MYVTFVLANERHDWDHSCVVAHRINSFSMSSQLDYQEGDCSALLDDVGLCSEVFEANPPGVSGGSSSIHYPC